jgi:hypothetical protein
VKAESEHACVKVQKILSRKAGNNFGALGVLLKNGAIFLHDAGRRFPVDVLGGIVERITSHW